MHLFRVLLTRQGVRTIEDFLPLYREAVKSLGLQGVAAEPHEKTFQAWIYQGRRPQRAFRQGISAMFGGRSIDELWSPASPAAFPSGPQLLTDTSHLYQHPTADIGPSVAEMKRTGVMAVDRAKEFLLGKDRGAVGDETIALLDDEVQRLAEQYPRQPLALLWDDLLATQDQVLRLLEGGRVHRATQLRQLNMQGALVSFMVAKGFHDMKSPHQAMTMARVAASCARTAEHSNLIALTEGLKALVTYWAGKPSDSVHYATQGAELASAPQGTAKLWLLGLQARAAGTLGDEATVREVNRQADDLREATTADHLDELGGLFTYSPAKQMYYRVESEVQLGLGHPDLVAAAEQAVEGLADPDAENWAFGDLAGSRCNLALVRLFSGDVEGAAESVRPVLDLPTTHRNAGIVVSAQRVHQAVANSPARASATGKALCEEIEAFPAPRLSLPRG